MSEVGFSRYVAMGDSQTEGLWDGDDTTGVIGFADRLAANLDSLYPGLLYANLAIRGNQIVDVLNDQLPQALAMEPDLITCCIGMNDVTIPGRGFESALFDLEEIYRQLADSGATVLTTIFPDVVKLLPTGRFIADRVHRINSLISASAQRYDFALVDLYTAPSISGPDTWNFDKMHASTKGHILFAEAAAEALNLPGSNHDWAIATGRPEREGALDRTTAQLQWMYSLFIPWLWRCLLGRSAGDGMSPKYPELQPVSGRVSRRLLQQESQ